MTTKNKSISDANAILKLLTSSHRQWLSLRVISDETGIGRDRARRLLISMAEIGWVQLLPDNDGNQYTIGSGLVNLAASWMKNEAERLREFLDTFGPTAQAASAFATASSAVHSRGTPP